MNDSRSDWSRPERILLLLARGGGESRGKAIRLTDSSELRFESMNELVKWLETPITPNSGD
jgi:hypothetical protein